MQTGVQPGMQTGVQPGMQTGVQPGMQTGVQAPGQVPPVASGAGQGTGLWGGSEVRLPQAAPTPVMPQPYAAAQEPEAPGAPLPRVVGGPGRDTEPVAESRPVLTGVQGFPAVAGGVGAMLGLLWLQGRTRRGQRSRTVL
ncbi:hypothetical protein GCM10010517_54620 [Streptosporangium fragile]|uniref:Uncharacterized protein n=2 Tax=Streptosporangium fragile TaxID=46186 RepID=A0ABN3W549_9ACTN